MLCSNGFCMLMLSPRLSVCLPTHPCAFPRCLQLPHRVGVRLGEETWGPHIVVLLLQGPGFLSAPFTHLEGGANLSSPHPREELPHPPSPCPGLRPFDLWPPSLPCPWSPRACASQHGLGRRARRRLHQPDCPTPVNVTTAQTLFHPPGQPTSFLL